MSKLGLVFALLLTFNTIPFTQKDETRVLVFSKTAGFRHSSITAGTEALKKLGQENGFKVDPSEDATLFTKKKLRKYDVIIFLNTTGDIFNKEQEEAFQHYVRSGGGVVGIHAASDTEFNWPWYGEMIGAYFKSHPHQQNATLEVVDLSHTSTRHLSKEWVRFDEWYNFKFTNPSVNVLIKIDEGTYEGGKNGNDHPVAWYHDFEGGRVFYTALGHTEASYSEHNFLQHLLGGIHYALGTKIR